MKYLLTFLLFTSCAQQTMLQKAVVQPNGKLKPVSNWQKFTMQKGDTISIIAKR